jgi:hypothetical protein
MATSADRKPAPERKTIQRSQRLEIDPRLYHLPAKVHIERRNGSPRLYVRAFIGGKSRIKCTGEVTEGAAVRKANEIYLDWMIAERAGNLPRLPGGPTPVLFKTAYESFIKRASAIEKVTPAQVKNYRDKWTLLQSNEYVIDGRGLGTMALADVTTDWLEQLRAKRKASTHVTDSLGRKRERKEPVSNNTISKDFDFIRLVLKHARDRDRTLKELPVFPEFEGRVWSVPKNRRPFFPPKVWTKVKRAALERASDPALDRKQRERRKEHYAYLLLCVGAALNPSEADSLRWKDCVLGTLGGLECVRLVVGGKHLRHVDTGKNVRNRRKGWALFDGVTGYKFLRKLYPNAKPDENLFKYDNGRSIVELLKACGEREDPKTGMTRDAKSLRPTGISLRLMMESDPSYNDLADWARTHPDHIRDFYNQVDEEWRVRRMLKRQHETPAERERRETLEKVRRQIAIEAMRDNDDVFGFHPDDDVSAPEPMPETDREWEEQLSIASRDEDTTNPAWEEHLSTKSRRARRKT